jgi:hypothetical protein
MVIALVSTDLKILKGPNKEGAITIRNASFLFIASCSATTELLCSKDTEINLFY